jgi:hypothetical protein
MNRSIIVLVDESYERDGTMEELQGFKGELLDREHSFEKEDNFGFSLQSIFTKILVI